MGSINPLLGVLIGLSANSPDLITDSYPLSRIRDRRFSVIYVVQMNIPHELHLFIKPFTSNAVLRIRNIVVVAF